MPVCRLIFRLDFKRSNFDILGQPGEIMKLLSSNNEKLWSELSEATGSHTITAKFVDPERRIARQMTVEPKSINGGLDCVEGIEIKKLFKDETFIEINRILAEIRARYKISELSRAGFRIFYLSKLGTKPGEVNAAFRKMFADDLVSSVLKVLGEIKDSGVALDGEADDKLKFRYRCGPYQSEEAAKYFADELLKAYKEDQERDFICEMDIYEHNFNLGDISFEKWCRPVIAKMSDAIDSSEHLIKSRLGIS